MLKIESNKLTVCIDELGAQMSSIYLKEDGTDSVLGFCQVQRRATNAGFFGRKIQTIGKVVLLYHFQLLVN